MQQPSRSVSKQKANRRGQEDIHFMIGPINDLRWPRPLPPEKWAETPGGAPGRRPPGLYTGALIAQVRYRSIEEHAISFTKAIIKGRLPHHEPYYMWTCRVEAREDHRGPYFQILKVLGCKRQPFNYSILRWILRYEVGYSESECDRATEGLSRFGEQAILPKKLPPRVLEDLKVKSYYYRQQSTLESALLKWFPVSGTWMTQNMDVSQEDELKTLLDTAPWRLAFKPIAKHFGFPTPIKRDHLVRHLKADMIRDDQQTWLFATQYNKAVESERKNKKQNRIIDDGMIDDDDDDDDVDQDEDLNSIANSKVAVIHAALECYEFLCRRSKQRGHTVFYDHDVKPEWHIGGDWSPLRFLVTVVGEHVLMERLVAGRTVLMLAKHHRQTESILAALRNLWHRHYRTSSSSSSSSSSQPPTVSNEDLSSLDSEQRKALKKAEQEPLLLLSGMPGTGKTYVLEQLVAQQEQRKKGSCLLCTLTGTMVSGHHERGLTIASTIHRPLSDLDSAKRRLARDKQRMSQGLSHQYERSLIALEQIQERLAGIEWLLIDEFSNVDLKLFERILTLCPNIHKLILIYDRWQTPPIDPGSPCLEMDRVLTSYRVQLQANHRTAGSAAHLLVENDRRLLQLAFDQLAFKHVTAGDNELSNDDDDDWPALDHGVRPGCFFVAPSGRGLAHDIQWMTETFCPDTDRRQILTLTHDLRLKVNTIVDCQQARMAGVHHQQQKQTQQKAEEGQLLYSGQRISVRDFNFRAVNHVNLEQLTGLKQEKEQSPQSDDDPSSSSHRGHHPQPQARKQRRSFGKQAQHQKEQYKHQSSQMSCPKSSEFRSDAFNNHEIFIFDHCQDYDVKRGRWSTHRLRKVTRHELGRPPHGHVRFLRTRCGSQFCLHDKHVRPEKVEVAWATTVNSFQGREEDAIIKLLPEDPFGFTIHHLHVSMSRAKRCLVFYGSMAQLKTLACNRVAPRQSILGYLIKQSMERWKTTAHIPSGFLNLLKQA